MSEKKEKKSERLEIRLPYSKKEAFLDACEQQSDTPSNAVRRFINSYIRRSNADDLKFSLGVLWRNWFRPVPVAVTAAVVLGGLWAADVFAPPEVPAKERYFAQLDQDNSGDIVQSELELDSREYKIIMTLFDKDKSDSLSLEEYKTRGDIGIMVQDSDNPELIDGTKPIPNIRSTKLVSFTLTPNTQIVSIWEKGENDFKFTSDIVTIYQSDSVPEVFQ